jgi:hypothetical protein
LKYTTTRPGKSAAPARVSNGKIPDLLDLEMFCTAFKLAASQTRVPENSK